MIKIVDRLLGILSSLIDLAIVLFLCIILAFGIYGMWDVQEIYHAAESERFVSYKPDKRMARPEYSFEELKKKNREAIGWIEIFDTSVDYPVMQAKDNVRYLTTDALGGYSAAGSIFLDANNRPDFSDRSAIVYGHHMAHRAMFSDLDHFAEKDFFDKHLYGDLYVDGKRYGLRILAYLRASAADEDLYRFSFQREEDWQMFLAHIKNIAIHDRFSELSKQEQKEAQLVIMSTCTEASEVRQIVIAQKTKEVFANPFLEGKNEALTIPEREDEKGNWNLYLIVFTVAVVVLIVLYFYSGYQLQRRRRHKACVAGDSLNGEGVPSYHVSSEDALLSDEKKESFRDEVNH